MSAVEVKPDAGYMNNDALFPLTQLPIEPPEAQHFTPPRRRKPPIQMSTWLVIPILFGAGLSWIIRLGEAFGASLNFGGRSVLFYDAPFNLSWLTAIAGVLGSVIWLVAVVGRKKTVHTLLMVIAVVAVSSEVVGWGLDANDHAAFASKCAAAGGHVDKFDSTRCTTESN